MPPLDAGSKVGPYVVVARLGTGGMGEVWRARDERLDREVALKVLPSGFLEDEERRLRFEREAKLLASLSHPNVATLYAFEEIPASADSPRRHVLAMELIEGGTLRRLLDAGRPPLRRALRIAAAIADGLAATHAKGIVHRDLKPENVAVTDDDIVKVLDFGIAKSSPLAAAGRDDTLPEAALGTEPGSFLGTVGYMSPEQAAGESVDYRSDQFAFGTILYELATGERAWTKPTAAETLVAILREEPPRTGALPAALRRIVERCLAKDPAARFASTRDLARDVRDLLEGTDAVPEVTVAPRVRSRTRLPRFAWAAALAASAVVAFFLVRGRLETKPVSSIAVLPFEGGPGGETEDYVRDGLTETLIERLSRLPDVRVMARATVFRFRGSTDPVKAGKALGVSAVVTGSVARRGDRILVSAEAVDARTGARLWGDRYDRPVVDLVRVEAELASDLAAGLRLRASEPERRALARPGTSSSEAYDAYLRARFASLQDTEAGYLEAIRLFRAATEKDPSFAEAHLRAADTYGEMASGGYLPPAEAWARSDEGARRALVLDPDLPDAKAALAARRAYYDWDFDGAERDFRELFDGPRPPVWHARAFALLLWARGRTEEAIERTERARTLDPGNVVFTVASGDYRAQAGRLGEAVGLYRAAIDAEPEDPRAWFGLAAIFRSRGEAARAIESLRKAYAFAGEKDGAEALAGASTVADYDAVQLRVARSRLAEAEALARTRYVSPLDTARLAAMAGEKERALAGLGAALKERSPGLVFLNVDRVWDVVRADPRFSAVVRKVGLS
ncbi:MAG TPA: protein kinase [Thermoanaerobaculia bacterium]|nr:protein kinase [Thermoanaerobaculia bacterium]